MDGGGEGGAALLQVALNRDGCSEDRDFSFSFFFFVVVVVVDDDDDKQRTKVFGGGGSSRSISKGSPRIDEVDWPGNVKNCPRLISGLTHWRRCKEKHGGNDANSPVKGRLFGGEEVMRIMEHSKAHLRSSAYLIGIS